MVVVFIATEIASGETHVGFYGSKNHLIRELLLPESENKFVNRVRLRERQFGNLDSFLFA